MPGAFVAQVECYGVSGDQAPHKRGEFDLLWPQKYVDVIVQESPGKAVCTGFSKKSGKAGGKWKAIFVVKEDGAFFNAPDDNMVQNAEYVDSGGSWHGVNLTEHGKLVNNLTTSPLGAYR